MSQVNVAITDGKGGPTWWKQVKKHLNFYRIHVMYYIFTPLIFSGIFYASNGRYPVAYIDCLYACVSAMAVCGLVTVNLSALTGWQQAILFIQISIGSPVVVSWITVYLRRHYFAIKFEHVLKANAEKDAAEAIADPEKRSSHWPRGISTILRRGRTGHAEVPEKRDGKKSGTRKLRPDIIRKMDDEPKHINPSSIAVPFKRTSNIKGGQTSRLSFSPSSTNRERERVKSRQSSLGGDGRRHYRRLSDPGLLSRPASTVEARFPRSHTMQAKPAPSPPSSPGSPTPFARTQTIGFAPDARRRRGRSPRRGLAGSGMAQLEPHLEYATSDHRSTCSRRESLSHQPSSALVSATRSRASESSKHRGFGGFPTPFDLISRLWAYMFPKSKRKLKRTFSVPATTSLVSRGREAPPGARSAPYISFDATVGRNSAFYRLSQDEMEELGGVEYRALNLLLWIVGLYHITLQLIGLVVIAPYISRPKWHDNFVPPAEMRPQSPIWFSIFQAVSAATNTGMSLVDKSMVPFQTAYPMVFVMIFLILAGSTAFPVFLRFTIWVLSKLLPKTSRVRETLHFLLDHPRRCFILLFPPHQTWFLLTVVCGLTFISWFFFMVLDIGNPGTDSIPLGVRFVVGLFQSVAVRSAGFAAVSGSALVASVKFLFLIMMYISVYPIAMSIRSTNVYEEQSLGIFPSREDIREENFEATGPRMNVWGRYLAMHARRQLAFDMWWLAAAVFVVCINERHRLDDPSVSSWFNIFSVIFELVSAYGTIGFSLGTPNNNFSFSGELRALSKFVICLVMIRGRHRILPVAIDRAVMLPSELQTQLDQEVSQPNTPQSGSRAVEGDLVPSERGSHSSLMASRASESRDGGQGPF